MSPLYSSLYLCLCCCRRANNRWHETQAVYSCDFQPLPLAQLKRLLSEDDDPSKDKEKAGSSSTGPIIAGGRQYRLATGGGDSKVRVRPFLSAEGEIHDVAGG
jgi:hypothetical protein